MKSIPEDLKIALGQCFWIGLNGFDAKDAATSEIFRSFQPGGVIFFQRNVKSPTQVRKMNADLQAMSSIPLFVAIDQEGGSVERLHEMIGTIPPAMAMAAARDLKGVREIHGAHARILASLGFNVNFTPVLDLAVRNADNGLGTRCFSDNPRTVVTYAKEVVHAFNSEGVLICGKHFPGLGDTNLDSHVDLPTVPRSWTKIQREDLLPYNKLLNDLPFIMVNHALYPGKNPRLPASLAPEIVADLLIRSWNYDGIAISDDLIMGAVSRFYSLTESAQRALLAGNHMFLICKPEGVVRAYRELLRLVHEDAKLQQAVHRNASRILAFKFGLSLKARKPPAARDLKILERAGASISEKAITLLHGKRPSRLPREVTVFLPRTKWLKSGRSALHAALAGHGCKATERYYDIRISDREAGTLALSSRTAWNIVITTSLSGRPGQKALVQALLHSKKRVILINGYFPNDWIPKQVDLAIAIYWTAPSALRAAADAIAGKLRPAGKLPLQSSRS